jgi:hypothetical protein
VVEELPVGAMAQQLVQPMDQEMEVQIPEAAVVQDIRALGYLESVVLVVRES